MGKHTRDNTATTLTTAPASRLQRRLAFIVSVLLGLVVLVAFPYVQIKLAYFPLYIAFYSTAAFLLDLITAYLLFGQSLRTQSPYLLALAMTYLFSCLIIIPHVLSFPGLFSETGLLHAETQTTNWLWIFWHTGLALGILGCVLLEKRFPAKRVPVRWIFILLALIPLLVLLLTLVAIQSNTLLPILIVKGDFSRINTSGIGPVMVGISLCAWIFSLPRKRDETVVHLWLNVAALSVVLDITLNLVAGNRYSLGWYLGRANSVMSATTVLCALLYQVNGLYQKVTEQLDQLQQVSQARDQFLATMSHELRTPLTSILGFSELLLDKAGEAGGNQQQRDNLQIIHRNGEHLLGLINEVLDLSKIQAGRMSVRYSQVNVKELLTGVVREVEPLALTHNLLLQTKIEENVHILETDASKVHRILLNLLSNALKFTDQGGVTLSASRVMLAGQAEGVAFAVQDTGIGIPAEQQAHIFEAFYQADMSYTRKMRGTGLGLPIVKELLTLLGGTIQVQSAPGKGSTFTVTLPLQAISPPGK